MIRNGIQLLDVFVLKEHLIMELVVKQQIPINVKSYKIQFGQITNVVAVQVSLK